ncbi:MAG: hypothetical protein AB7I13_07625 [Vicinamibacterales bacterium]
MSAYPVTIKWDDGSVTHFNDERDHLRRIIGCEHSTLEGFLGLNGQVFKGCWKCMSAPIWEAAR